MMDRNPFDGKAQRGDYIVRGPRLGDAIGDTLKSIYSARALPQDMQDLLRQLETVRH